MKARAFPLAVACLLAIASRTAGQDVDAERESLRGLDGLRVQVEDLTDKAREGGLTEAALHTYLEMRLRQARIPILPKDEGGQSRAYLYLEVRAIPVRARGGWTYRLDLDVKQRACIRGGGSCPWLTTWDVGALVITPDNLADHVRGVLVGYMDDLVNDYLAANP